MAGFSFGTPAAQSTTAAPPPAFSFGAQPAAASSTSTAPANPFGASTSTSTGAGAFGGFGAKPAAPAGTTGGLFGATSTTGATGSGSGSGLFGSTAGATAGTSLFGSGFGQPAQQQPQQQQQQQSTTGTTGAFGLGGSSTFGGFGATQQNSSQQQQQQQNSSSLFGSTNQSSLFPSAPSNGLFQSQNGSSFQQQPASDIVYRNNQPGRLGLNSIWVPEGPLTRRSIPRDEMFKLTAEGDPALAGLLRELESELNRQKSSFDEIKTGTLGNDIWTLREKTKQLSAGYYTYTSTTSSLQRHLGTLQTAVQSLQDDLYKAASVVQWQMGHPDDLKGFEGVRDVPAEFFSKIARDCETRAEGYKKALDQIERQLQSLWNNQNAPSAQAISQSMSNNQDLIMALAVQVAEIDERVKVLVDSYRQRFREKYQTTKDPVSERRRVDGLPAKGYSGDRDDGLLSGMAGVAMSYR